MSTTLLNQFNVCGIEVQVLNTYVQALGADVLAAVTITMPFWDKKFALMPLGENGINPDEFKRLLQAVYESGVNMERSRIKEVLGI